MSRILSDVRIQGLGLVLGAIGLAAGFFAMLPAITSEIGATATAAGIEGADAAVLAKLDDDWSAAAATKDADLVASFYAEDAIAYPPNAPAAVGVAAAREVWAAYFADPNLIISWKTQHAGVAKSGDMGFTSGAYELSYSGANGAIVHEKGKYLCTWEKGSDGSWKATHDMWNSDSM